MEGGSPARIIRNNCSRGSGVIEALTSFLSLHNRPCNFPVATSRKNKLTIPVNKYKGLDNGNFPKLVAEQFPADKGFPP